MTTLAATSPDLFTHWSGEHWLVILATALATALPAILLRSTRTPERRATLERAVSRTFALLLVAAFVGGHAHRVVYGYWTLEESLPIQLCDLAVFATVASLLTADRVHRRGSPPPQALRRTRWRDIGPWQQSYELAYFWVLGGTLQALITPDLEGHFPSFVCIRFFVLHSGIVVAVLVLTIGLRLRPLPGAVQRTWLITLAAAVVVGIANAGLNAAGVPANYMYLCGPPKAASLFDLMGPWPWSLAALAGVATVIFGLLYAPFWMRDRIQSYRSSLATPHL